MDNKKTKIKKLLHPNAPLSHEEKTVLWIDELENVIKNKVPEDKFKKLFLDCNPNFYKSK